VQVSLSSEPAIATTPFCLLSTGAGSDAFGVEVAEEGGLAGVEVPAPTVAALRLANKSTYFFFLYSLMAMYAQRQQVKMKGQDMQLTTTKQVKV